MNAKHTPGPGMADSTDAENEWFGDMMILQVLADSERVNDQEREVLTRWMAASQRPGVEAQDRTSDAAIFAIAGTLGYCKTMPANYCRELGLPVGERWITTMKPDDLLLFARALLAACAPRGGEHG